MMRRLQVDFLDICTTYVFGWKMRSYLFAYVQETFPLFDGETGGGEVEDTNTDRSARWRSDTKHSQYNGAIDVPQLKDWSQSRTPRAAIQISPQSDRSISFC